MNEYTTLGELISPAKVIRCGKGTYPVLSMTMHEGIVLQSDRFKKSLASTDQSDYKVVKHGQLVVGFPIDEGVLYIQKVANEGIMSPAYNVWDVNTSKVEADYLELCLHSPQAMQYYSDKLRGSTARRRSIPTTDLLALPIRLPSLDEQRKKISLINKMNAVIEDRKQQLNFANQLVKSRFIEMFGEPETNPFGYPIKALSEIATYWNGLTYKPEDVQETGTIVLRSSNIQNSQLDFEDTVRVQCPIRDKQFVKENDILMCSRNGSARLVGKVALIQNIQEPMSFGAFMMIIRSKYYRYLMTFFQMDAFRNQIKTGATTTINQITGNMLNQVTLPVPDMATVEKFAAFVEQVDKSKFYIQKTIEIHFQFLKKSSWREKHDYY